MVRPARPDAIKKPGILRLGTISALGVMAAGLMAGPGGLLRIRAAEMTTSAVTFPIPSMASSTPKAPPRVAAPVAAEVTTTTVARLVSAPKAPPVTAKSALEITAPPTTSTTGTAPAAVPSRQADAPAPTPTPTSIPAPAAVPPATAPTRSVADPATSVSPSPQMKSYCFSGANVPACDNAALAAIDAARGGEGLGALQLPSDFYTLDPDTQVITVINAERTSRGLPAFAYDASYQPAAQAGAQAGTDPEGPSSNDWAAIYAAGYATALAADFGWMYDDGIGSPNVECSASSTAGCWGHRDAILSPWAGAAAAASTNVDGALRLFALFVGP